MYFRFVSAVVVVVLISLAGIALEKNSLEIRRLVSRQHYQLEALYDSHARLKARTQELAAPARLLEPIERGDLELPQPEQSFEPESPRIPMLRWQSSGSFSW